MIYWFMFWWSLALPKMIYWFMFWWSLALFCPLKIGKKLHLPVNGSPNSISIASSDVSIPTCGVDTAKLSFHNRTYPTKTFSVIENLCSDVIVGQEFLKLHSSVTFVMNGPEEALTIPPLKTQLLPVAAPRLTAPVRVPPS